MRGPDFVNRGFRAGESGACSGAAAWTLTGQRACVPKEPSDPRKSSFPPERLMHAMLLASVLFDPFGECRFLRIKMRLPIRGVAPVRLGVGARVFGTKQENLGGVVDP